jgi:hypothetical protein
MSKGSTLSLFALLVAACASSQDSGSSHHAASKAVKPAAGAPAVRASAGATADTAPSAHDSEPVVSNDDVFMPPAPRDGYLRLSAATIHDIQPGADVTYCQYAMAPVDHDMDVLDVRGSQSKWGHHVVAFTYTGTGSEELGKTVACNATEFSTGTPGMGSQSLAAAAGGTGMGTFLGSAASQVPEGVAFRLKKGDGILLNIHYINAGNGPIDGDAYLDVKLAEADPNRMLAAMFIAINTGFDVAAHQAADSMAECKVGADLAVIMMANHMHEYGVHATTSVLRDGSGSPEMLRDDPEWTYEMQFNPVYSRWSVDSPLMLHSGDTLRTSCSWMNTSDASLGFPREMCISVGFVLTTGDKPTAPGACFNGRWVGGLH